MDWNANHADYVIAAYAIALVIVLWCVIGTYICRVKDKSQ